MLLLNVVFFNYDMYELYFFIKNIFINIKKIGILMGIQTHDDFATPFPSI